MNISPKEIKKLKTAFLEIWNDIKNTVKVLLEAIEEAKGKKKEHEFLVSKWIVPFNTCKESQVLNRKPKMIYIRNSL